MVARGAAAVGSLALGSLAQLAAPLTALLTLGARPFGQFSVVYLLFAWGLSLQLSICSEPFVRHRIEHGTTEEQRRGFRAASATVGATLGVIAGSVAAAMWSWGLAVVTVVAVAGTIVRIGSRYQAVVERGLRAAARGDALFVLGFATTLALGRGHVGGTSLVLLAWAVGAVASVVLGSGVPVPRPRLVRRWVRTHSASIRPLLKDSLVLDTSAIGGAYLLLPLLSVQEFGVYRAVSNVATPARLVTDAVRPLIGRPMSHRRQRLMLAGVLALGAAATVVATLALLAVDRADLDLGVVNDLAPYAVQTGVFVGASVVGAIFYFRARAHGTSRQLWRGRLLQSGSALAGPLLGAATAGLTGAITGTAIAAAFGAAVWWLLAHRSLPDPGSVG